MARAWCKHYHGMHLKDSCEADVRFDSLPKHGTKEFMDCCPCFGPSSGCDKAEYPTAEELAADEAAMKVRFENRIVRSLNLLTLLASSIETVADRTINNALQVLREQALPVIEDE